LRFRLPPPKRGPEPSDPGLPFRAALVTEPCPGC
jgi:hypothetical protein